MSRSFGIRFFVFVTTAALLAATLDLEIFIISCIAASLEEVSGFGVFLVGGGCFLAAAFLCASCAVAVLEVGNGRFERKTASLLVFFGGDFLAPPAEDFLEGLSGFFFFLTTVLVVAALSTFFSRPPVLELVLGPDADFAAGFCGRAAIAGKDGTRSFFGSGGGAGGRAANGSLWRLALNSSVGAETFGFSRGRPSGRAARGGATTRFFTTVFWGEAFTRFNPLIGSALFSVTFSICIPCSFLSVLGRGCPSLILLTSSVAVSFGPSLSPGPPFPAPIELSI
mmetsp:Transcript_7518/g.15689  ORF Transcript_7518/g.15689 Transcript_7518/m.15689 type:complete len:282 (-) Transcript_7518:47-892(-)